MKYGSLFTGVGGFELGFNKLGWTCEWMCEKDKYAKDVLKHNWPSIPIYDDVQSLHGNEVEPVDIICGGFPCQDMSIAGLGAGITGARSGLFFDYVRIVKEMREATNNESPKAVIWENVPGILNVKKDWISSVYTAWGEIGAVVQEHRSHNAQYFGLAQRRKRVIGVVVFDTRADCGKQILFDGEAMYSNLDKIRTPWQETTGTTKGKSDSSVQIIPFDTTQITNPNNGSNPQPGDPMHPITASGHTPKIAFSVTPIGGQGADLSATKVEIGNTLTAIAAPDRGIMLVDPPVPFSPDVAGTLVAHDAKDNSEPEHKTVIDTWGVRRLTPIESERLMGWPDNHTAMGTKKAISDYQRRKMCGNGLVAPVAEWAGRRVQVFLESLDA